MTPGTLRVGFVVCAAAFMAAAPAVSQSLADVARQEEARRNGLKATSTTFTNSSLKPDPNAPTAVDGALPSVPPPIATPVNPNQASAGAATPVNGTPATAAASAPPADDQLDEALWRRRAGDTHARFEKTRKDVAKYTGLKHDDPREQAKLDALLKRAQNAFALAQESLKAFEQEAAAVGVPPNWIK